MAFFLLNEMEVSAGLAKAQTEKGDDRLPKPILLSCKPSYPFLIKIKISLI